MTVPTSIKTRLLELHRSGKFSTLPPAKLAEFYRLCHDYLALNPKPSSNITEYEYYQLVELQFFLSLQTNHDIEAKATLQQLCDKFDLLKSERLLVLESQYVEATKGAEAALATLKDSRIKMVKRYDKKPDNLMAVRKRELILQSRMGKPDPKSYAESLLSYLEIQPSDMSVWFELSQVYYQNGELDKCIYALQEILLVQPFAYNVMARLGETYYLNFIRTLNTSAGGKLSQQTVDVCNENKRNAVKYFSRSVELCSTYTRAWVGLYKATMPVNQAKVGDTKFDTKLNALAKQNLVKLQQGDLINEASKQAVEHLITL